MLWKILSIVICFYDRFLYYMSIQYWPNNRSMKVSIDTYCRPQKLQKAPIDTCHKKQQASFCCIGKGSYPLSTVMTWNLLYRVATAVSTTIQHMSYVRNQTRVLAQALGKGDTLQVRRGVFFTANRETSTFSSRPIRGQL